MDEVQGIETVYIPEPGSGHVVHFEPGGLRDGLHFLRNRAARFQPQFERGGNRRSGLAGAARTGARTTAPRSARASRKITNIVFMGMGEPLANYRNVLPAMRIFLDDLGYDLSRRRVTLSTSGLVPQIYKLAEECNVALAVSLHAPNDELRDQLVPINRKHPIAELLEACWHYIDQAKRTQHHVRVRHARRRERQACACAAARAPAARPSGKTQSDSLQCVSRHALPPLEPAAIVKFRDILNDHGVIATVRRTRGDDIDAACGQLAGRVTDRTLVRLGTKLGAGARAPAEIQ